MVASLSFLLALIPLSLAASGDRPCVDLSACALKKCLNKKSIMARLHNSSSVDVFEKVVTSFDMICITTKCSNECSGCKSCEYANRQIAMFTNGEGTGGICPRLESCIGRCVKKDDLPEIFKCINDDCNVHCYDGSCAQCKALSKRIFTRFCREADLMEMHVFSDFQGTCPALFDRLASEFVVKKKH